MHFDDVSDHANFGELWSMYGMHLDDVDMHVYFGELWQGHASV
jgi:hypothetical protein